MNSIIHDLGLGKKIKGTGSSVKEQIGYFKGGSVYLKNILKSDQVVCHKTDAIAVLVRRKGNELAFFEAFDKMTKEGYKMVLHEEINDPVPGLNIKLAYLFYFQNPKFLK